MRNELPEVISQHELRAVVVAPTGRDAELICDLLTARGISCVKSHTTADALVESKMGAGAVIIAEEALGVSDIERWSQAITNQPSWSDLPIIILTFAGRLGVLNHTSDLARQRLGNVVLLERPSRSQTFISAVQAALRSRRRQYQIRDYLAERKVTEETLRKTEKLAVVGRLAASIAHEINNPLTSVTNLLYLIETSSTLQQSQQFASVAMSELARVSEIVTQTLRFHQQQTKPSMIQVADVVESVLVLFGGRLVSARIAIERDFRECRPILAMASELRQMVANLVGNSLDAMNGGGTLSIRVADTQERRNGARSGIRLTVADTGSGIAPEVKNRLFEPFVSTKGNTGCGLGLWVSSGIIQKHGGSVRVKSRTVSHPTGSVFSVFLPSQPHLESASPFLVMTSRLS
jgi:signal transduction histidine kinase